MLSELKKLSEAATPGPWEFYLGGTGEYPIVFKKGLFAEEIIPLPKDANDMEFIAALNPATALKLIELVASARPMISELAECGCNRMVDSEMSRWLAKLAEFEGGK